MVLGHRSFMKTKGESLLEGLFSEGDLRVLQQDSELMAIVRSYDAPSMEKIWIQAMAVLDAAVAGSFATHKG